MKTFRITLVLCISTSIFLYFLTKLNVSDLLIVLKGASLKWIAAGCLAYWAQIILRAMRLKYMLALENRFTANTIGILGWHAILNNLLPFGLGEAAILFLFNKILNIEYSRSVSSLFSLRTIDVIVSSALFSTLFLFKSKISCFSETLWTIMISLFAICLILLLCIGLLTYSNSLLNRISDSNRFSRGFKSFLKDMRTHFLGYFSLDSVTILILFTLAIFLSTYFALVCACNSLNSDLTLTDMFFVFLLLRPIRILPIKGILDIGSHELGWILPLIIIGYTKPTAILIAFGTHTIFLLNALVTATALFFVYNKSLLRWIFDPAIYKYRATNESEGKQL